MVWEKFSCKSSYVAFEFTSIYTNLRALASFDGPQVRLILNDAPFPLSTCADSEEDRTYGSCALDAFVAANGFSTTIAWGDSAWNKTCGASDF